MNESAQAAVAMLREIARLEQALRSVPRQGGSPAGHAGIAGCMERIAALRTRSLPQVSPEFVSLLLAHAGLTQAFVAAALKADASLAPSREAVAEARGRMEAAVSALRLRCAAIRDGGTMGG